MTGKFELYSMVDCPFCDKAKELLYKNSVQYSYYVLNKDFDKKQLAERLGISPDSKITLPQIFLDNENIGGYSELKICFDAIRMMNHMKEQYK